MRHNQSDSDQRDQRNAERISHKTKMENQGSNQSIRDRQEDAPLAKDPATKRSDLADPQATPSQKKSPSALPGAEVSGDAGVVAGGAAAGTKGASSSSGGRKGDPLNYGTDQSGPGSATGPSVSNPTIKK